MRKNLYVAKQNLLQRIRRECSDERVLSAMRQVPREFFVPSSCRHLSYEDIALPIDEGQSISQPFIVAMMTSASGLTGSERVLEVGTGSGYQAAVLSLMVPQGSVVTVERVPLLAQKARVLLPYLGYHNVEVVSAGPTLGCPEKAPFDAIVVTAASPGLLETLLAQLTVGGRMVIPIGSLKQQELVRALKTADGVFKSHLGMCRFVPLIGEEAWSP